MKEIRINASVRYDVIVGSGVSASAPEFVRTALHRVGKVCVVADSNVDSLYADPVVSQMKAAGLEAEKFVFPAGEGSKCLQTFSSLMDFLAAGHFSRSDLVVALGGGVTGDLAGFAASAFKRGMGFVQMPTSLLAMVDSSVGGKTAVNISAGKNLVGAFYQPLRVFCDLDFLKTLPEEWRIDGMGEVLKYAILGDGSLFGELEKNPRLAIGESEIASCIDMKRQIVEQDEKEQGLRKFLNLGHTFAHAIELLSGYSISHGRAVGTGLAMTARLSKNLGCLNDGDCSRIESVVAAMGCRVRSEFAESDMANAILEDKKVAGGEIDFILPVRIGKCKATKIPLSDLAKVVRFAN
ncbi:MAG: 3-dehydroquinate synthase [Kiritimatiellae bacterium]|nr:3-dehydroquinate synthase [Kiritimatiellia bacterium]